MQSMVAGRNWDVQVSGSETHRMRLLNEYRNPRCWKLSGIAHPRAVGAARCDRVQSAIPTCFSARGESFRRRKV